MRLRAISPAEGSPNGHYYTSGKICRCLLAVVALIIESNDRFSKDH